MITTITNITIIIIIVIIIIITTIITSICMHGYSEVHKEGHMTTGHRLGGARRLRGDACTCYKHTPTTTANNSHDNNSTMVLWYYGTMVLWY